MFNENSAYNNQEEEFSSFQLDDITNWANQLESDEETIYEQTDTMNYFGAGANINGTL